MAEQNVTQIATPSEAVAVARETAAGINPLIGSLGIKDTLENTSGVVLELGSMVGDTNLARSNLSRVFEVVSAALNWELQNIQAAQREEGRMTA